VNSSFSWVAGSYFDTLRTPLIAGRDFNSSDVNTSVKVAVINETFARAVFSGANPIGRRFWVEATPGIPERVFEIVGVVKDTKYGDLREEFGPIAFLPVSQEPQPDPIGRFLIRSKLPEAQVTAAIKNLFAEINPGINISFQNFKGMINDGLLRDRLMATLSGFFGLLALLLASVGLYGILSYGVASRRNEIGIRMALGAQTGNVLSMILREAVMLAFVGIIVGLPFVFGVTRFASTMLFGLTPTDPLSLTAAAVFLFGVALLAGFLPARRASKIDPLEALRYE
jgi:predicted permease